VANTIIIGNLITVSSKIVKSNNVINLANIDQEFLRSNNVQFMIENETFQEVFCHKERLGDNDKVS